MHISFQDDTSARAGAWLTVNLQAIVNNYEHVARMGAGAECAAVVKADAYGLGATQVAQALADRGAKTFFVAHLDEGITLRQTLPDVRIFVLHGFMPGCESSMQAHGLTPVLNSLDQVRNWKWFCEQAGQAFPAALQFDSGMSRFGLSTQDLEEPGLFDGLNLQLVMSHLACADVPDSPANEMQRQRFVTMAAAFPGVPRSLAASSGIFLGPDYHFELIRPGAALYGIAPSEGSRVLEPVISLDARIAQIRMIQPGDRVGYGLSWTASKPTRIGTLGIGYADGFFRSQAGKASVWYGQTRLPVIGRVSMDSISVDLTEAPVNLKTGDVLSVLGPQQDVDALARSAGTIGYEVLTALGSRFHRVYVSED